MVKLRAVSIRTRWFSGLALAVVVAGCSGDRMLSTPSAKTPEVSVEVKASKEGVEMMVRTPSEVAGARGGTTLTLDASVLNPQGKELEHKKHVYWTSRDTLVATVDSNGVVTAQDTGRTYIDVDHKKGVDSVLIIVVPVPVAAVQLVGVDSVSLDDTVQFVATPVDSAGEVLIGRTVAWSSLASGVATVSATGEVIAIGLGTTRITATSEGKEATQLLEVFPQPVATVTVEPATVSVPQFQKVQFTATARDRRNKVLTGRAITWSSSNPAIFFIRQNPDTAAARDVGQAVITATIEGKTGTSDVTVTNPVEARALWVTRFEFTSATAVDFAKIATIFAKAATANINIVYFQARAAGDAFYFSDIEPCAPRMCGGTLGGVRPSRDPLDVALTEAAKHGIQVHAWVNAYTGFGAGNATSCNQFINSTPANWLKANPTWSMSTRTFPTGPVVAQVNNCLTSGEYMWVSPGVAQVRAQLARVSADIARRYGPKGLKGIHLDRIRYSARETSYDTASQNAFRALTGSFPTSHTQLTWANFRRGLVNQGVQQVFDSIRAVNPALVLSAAVFPGYKPKAGWAANWSFSDLYQDPQAWAQGGYLDVELPMTYPAPANPPSLSWTVKAYESNTDWAWTIDDHLNRIEKQSGRHVYAGIGGLRGWPEVELQIRLAHDRSITGVSLYSFSQIDAIPNGWALLGAGPFKHKATIPSMPWKQ